MKSSVGDCLFFLVERDLDGNFGVGLDTLSVSLNSEVTKSHPEGDDDIEFSID